MIGKLKKDSDITRRVFRRTMYGQIDKSMLPLMIGQFPPGMLFSVAPLRKKYVGNDYNWVITRLINILRPLFLSYSFANITY